MALGDEIKREIDMKRYGLLGLGLGIGKDLESQARINAPWVDDTANTRRAIHGGAEGRRNGVTVYLAHGSLVGLFMEEGTAPHVIKPKNKKALRFTIGGKTIFAKQVNHPGIEPRPTVQPTVASNWPKIKKEVRRYWENA